MKNKQFFSGVEDNGILAGLSREDMMLSLKTLRDMASRLGAETTVLRERVAKCKLRTSKLEEKRVAEVLVRKIRKGDADDRSIIIYSIVFVSEARVLLHD